MKFKILSSELAVCSRCDFLSLYMTVINPTTEKEGILSICCRGCNTKDDPQNYTIVGYLTLIRMIFDLGDAKFISDLVGKEIDLDNLDNFLNKTIH